MTYGSAYREQIVDKLRKAAEHCDCLQCFFIIHSMGGGKTGTGSTAADTSGSVETLSFCFNPYPCNPNKPLFSNAWSLNVKDSSSRFLNSSIFFMSKNFRPSHHLFCKYLGVCIHTQEMDCLQGNIWAWKTQASTMFHANERNQVFGKKGSECTYCEFKVLAPAWGPRSWACLRRSFLRCVASSPPSIRQRRTTLSHRPTTAF